MNREQALETLKEMAFTATESYRQALETAISALSENKEDTVSRGTLEQIMWERDTAIQQLKDLGYSLGEKPKKVLPSVENNGDFISRERLINEWDDLGRRYAMPTTPIHKRAFREFPSADMRGET